MTTRIAGSRWSWTLPLVLGGVLVAPVRALNGGVTFDYPSGAVACTYKIYDKDVRGNDLLESGDVAVPPTAEPTDKVKVGFGNLFCKGYEVQGPAGSSGESNAEILVEVTWTFESGNTSVQTQEKKLSCPQRSGPPKLVK